MDMVFRHSSHFLFYSYSSLHLTIDISLSLSLSLSLTHTHTHTHKHAHRATTPIWDSSTTKWGVQRVVHLLQGGQTKIPLSKGEMQISCNISRVSPLHQGTLKDSGGHKDLPLLKVEISMAISSFVDVVAPHSEEGVALG